MKREMQMQYENGVHGCNDIATHKNKENGVQKKRKWRKKKDVIKNGVDKNGVKNKDTMK